MLAKVVDSCPPCDSEKGMRGVVHRKGSPLRMLRGHRELSLNWFRATGQLSSGVVEGLNTTAKLTPRKAYGFRTSHAADIALSHTLGA